MRWPIGRLSLLALIRALYVLKDNWWLDEIEEEEVLARLEALERYCLWGA